MLKNTDFRRKKILFITGSQNQTSQMHQIAARLSEYDCFYSQIYSKHPIVRMAVASGLLDFTIFGGEFRKKGEAYLEKHRLKNDYAQSHYANKYDMAVLCTDLHVTRELRSLKTVWVQEGMTDPLTGWGKLVHRLGLPTYMAMNTALNGSGNVCDVYCAASHGYRQQFIRLGADPSRIFVTGIPNYDNVAAFSANDFPHHGYVLAATSDVRETFRRDDRPTFIRDCVKIAGGRRLIFKLHPNEKKERAIGEIRRFAPSDTLIFTEGNTENMIANCDELITQYSTVVYTGIALGKKVHSYFDVEELTKLAPVQNNGVSAANIAQLCRQYLEFSGGRDEFLKHLHTTKLSTSIHERERENCYHHSDPERLQQAAR
jgi:hypothetical protein